MLTVNKSPSKSQIQKKAVKKTNLMIKKARPLVNIQEENGSPIKTVAVRGNTANIRVAIRLRPLSKIEIDDDQFEIVEIVDNKVSTVLGR